MTQFLVLITIVYLIAVKALAQILQLTLMKPFFPPLSPNKNYKNLLISIAYIFMGCSCPFGISVAKKR
jgi:hypothetical protein